jgi:hypothetical protein
VNLRTNVFRVETGPVLLLDQETFDFDKPPEFADFRWAYVDYHGFDEVRCLLDRPTPILVDATFTPPAEHHRQSRANPALTPEQLQQLEQRVFDWPEGPLEPAELRDLFQTDHYSQAVELPATTTLYALDANHGK